ncbi:MAG: hypothetical protein KA479_02470 [Saprospiraceae bacterium]|nr:hypothetical protein [Saprospiraceae bacterium]
MNTLEIKKKFPWAWCLYLFLSFQILPGYGQLPNTHIYHFQLNMVGFSPVLSKPQFLTGFNLGGYNNQPFFKTKDEIWITSDYKGNGHTDLWKLNLSNHLLTRLSNSASDEFSPGIQPETDHISAVRIETDTAKTQRLWIFDRDKPNYGTAYPRTQKGVGYYAWKNLDTLALFIVGEPHQLMLHANLSGNTHLVALRAGRCFLFDPKGRLLYVQKVTEDSWYIKYYHAESGHGGIISKTLANSEDFCLLSDGSFLMASGSQIFRFRPEMDIDWQPFADLSVYGLQAINRIVQYGDNQLIVVNQMP